MTKPRRPVANKKHSQLKGSPLANVSSAFLENREFLKNFLRRFLSRTEDIEDVAQQAYINAYSAEQKQGIDQPKAYLFRVARNLALNELNRKSQQMTDYIEDRLASIPLDSGPSVEEEVEAEQSMNIYCEAVEALPAKCRRVFIMRKVNGMRHKEIADQLGITVGAVEKHLHNGARSCRAYIICANSEGAAGDEENLPHSHSKGGLH